MRRVAKLAAISTGSWPTPRCPRSRAPTRRTRHPTAPRGTGIRSPPASKESGWYRFCAEGGSGSTTEPVLAEGDERRVFPASNDGHGAVTLPGQSGRTYTVQRTHPPKRRPATSPHPRGPRHPAARDGFPSHFQAATPRPSSRSVPAPAPFSLLRAFAGPSWLPPSSPGVHRPCSRSILHTHPLNESEADRPRFPGRDGQTGETQSEGRSIAEKTG